MIQAHNSIITLPEYCPRCQLYKGDPEGVLHKYEFSPNAKEIEFPNQTLYFNVGEIRLWAASFPIVYMEPPYDEGFLNVLNWHEYVPGHVDHIPPESIRPSLCCQIEMKRKASPIFIITNLIVDGHHSAQRRVQQGLPVALQILPHELTKPLIRYSEEELMSQDVMIFEKIGVAE